MMRTVSQYGHLMNLFLYPPLSSYSCFVPPHPFPLLPAYLSFYFFTPYLANILYPPTLASLPQSPASSLCYPIFPLIPTVHPLHYPPSLNTFIWTLDSFTTTHSLCFHNSPHFTPFILHLFVDHHHKFTTQLHYLFSLLSNGNDEKFKISKYWPFARWMVSIHISWSFCQ